MITGGVAHFSAEWLGKQKDITGIFNHKPVTVTLDSQEFVQTCKRNNIQLLKENLRGDSTQEQQLGDELFDNGTAGKSSKVNVVQGITLMLGH